MLSVLGDWRRITRQIPIRSASFPLGIRWFQRIRTYNRYGKSMRNWQTCSWYIGLEGRIMHSRVRVSILWYSFVSIKRRVANKRRFWKRYLKLISVGSGLELTKGLEFIFVTLCCKEALENSKFFRFSPNFSMFFLKNEWTSLITASVLEYFAKKS